MPRKKQPNKDPAGPEAARAKALRLLARREHGAQELCLKLTRSGVPESIAENTVRECTRQNWQSDERYAQSVARTRVNQCYGPLRIRAELSAAGIDDTLIDAATRQPETQSWYALAQRAFSRRFRTPPENARQWQRAWHFLARRGFTAEQIRNALKHEPETTHHGVP